MARAIPNHIREECAGRTLEEVNKLADEALQAVTALQNKDTWTHRDYAENARRRERWGFLLNFAKRMETEE